MRPLALLLGCLLATPTFASPVLRHTWGPADALVTSQNWTGPTTYRQTVSVTGLTGTVNNIQVVLTISPLHSSMTESGEIWTMLFNNGPGLTVPLPRLDCTRAVGFAADAAVDGADPIPGAVLDASISLGVNLTRPPIGTYGVLLLNVSVPSFVADPAVRYGIATLEYRLENAELGASSPALCDAAADPICWVNAPSNVDGVHMAWEAPSIHWGAAGAPECVVWVTPTRTSTWGALKQIYR